ncbi:MAG: hypothetical protein MZW92_47845 [Comamonadaceae bacterium]|nr:hypothetical protein [Comamonadaceae bacterium]
MHGPRAASRSPSATSKLVAGVCPASTPTCSPTCPPPSDRRQRHGRLHAAAGVVCVDPRQPLHRRARAGAA